jgi:hypothetical protein
MPYRSHPHLAGYGGQLEAAGIFSAATMPDTATAFTIESPLEHVLKEGGLVVTSFPIMRKVESHLQLGLGVIR